MNQPITLGVDFGATSIKFGVVQVGRIIKHGNVVPTRQDGEIEPMIRSIVAEIFSLREQYPALQAVGFGVPGIIDPVAGIVVNLTNVKGWRGIPLAALVSGRIRRTIKSRCERTFWEKLTIVPAALGNEAGVIGAAALAFDSEFAAARRASTESRPEKPH